MTVTDRNSLREGQPETARKSGEDIYDLINSSEVPMANIEALIEAVEDYKAGKL